MAFAPAQQQLKADLEEALGRLSQIGTGDVQGIAASQIQLLSSFYDLALDQARRSFRWALLASVVGLIFFILAITFYLYEQGPIANVSVISGALIEFIAGVNFYLYGRTINQLSLFQGRLDVTQRFLLANSLCEGLDGNLKGETRAALIRKLADADPLDSAGEG